jgi:hypothetical protein
LLLRVLDAAARMKNMKINWDGQYAIFPHELQSLLRLTWEFRKFIYELYKFYCFCVTNLTFKH